MKAYLKENPDIADDLEAKIRQNAIKLMTPQAKVAAEAAGRVPSSDGPDNLR